MDRLYKRNEMPANKPQMLILTPQLPYPPHQGTSIRNYNLIKGLAARYDLVLISFAVTPPDQDALEHLRAFCRDVQTIPQPQRGTRERILSTLASPLPDMGLRLESAAFHRRMGALLAAQPFDIIQVEGIEMAPYLFQIAQTPGLRSLLVLDDHNAEYVLQRRAFETDLRKPIRWAAAAYSLVQWLKLRRYERRACQAAQRVIAVSDADAEALRHLVPDLAPQVVPNGVDLEYWSPAAEFPPLSQSPSLVFVGKMDFRPNVDAALWFSRQVLPLIRAQYPTAHFYLVGQSPHARLAPLARHPAITITGYVSDVRPYVAGADVYVVPLRIGGGTRLKVLEAMAMHKAMVSTTLGCEGIGLTDGREALLADAPQGFAQAVIALLDDAVLRATLGQQAGEFVSQRYGWQRIVPLLEAAYGHGA